MRRCRQRIAAFAARLRRDRSGLTLVEVIVSLALLAIVTVLMANLLLMGLRMLGYNMPRSQLAQQAADKTDSGVTSGTPTGVTSSQGSFTITIDGGDTDTVSGTYRTGTQSAASGGSVQYWTFTPDSD